MNGQLDFRKISGELEYDFLCKMYSFRFLCLRQLNFSEKPCADFEARFCCPASSASEINDFPFDNETELLRTNVYDTTTTLLTDAEFEPTASTQDYFTTFFDQTTANFLSKRWSFEDSNLTEPESLNKLRNFIKY